MNLSAAYDTTMDTDFYLEASRHYPLLNADQERWTDLRKWAAARRCLRLMLADSDGRELIRDFATACLDTPPQVEQFQPRSLYFTLRKDLVELLPGASQADALGGFLASLEDSLETGRQSLARIDAMQWPATLSVGLSIIHLRRQGLSMPDLVSDALCQWQPAWRRRLPLARQRRPDTVLKNTLKQYVTARDRLVMHNLRLVHKLAWDHPGRNMPQRDLVQEGIIGLIRAAEKFDFSRGYRFTTYAYPWINQHLQRATESKSSLISYPAHVVQEINQLHRAKLAYLEKTGQDAGTEQLVQATGFDRDKVERLRRLTNITVSIDHPEADDNDLRHAASVPDPDSARAVEAVEASSVARLVWQHIGKLEERERAVITGRWGLDGRPQRTFAQLADQLHVSREWVRQLEKSALQKLGQEAGLNEAFEDLTA